MWMLCWGYVTRIKYYPQHAILALSIISAVVIGMLGRQSMQAATIDISWPNCASLPATSYRSAIIGVNGGLDFTYNPCLGREALAAEEISIYANTGNPGFPRIRKLGNGPLKCSTKHDLTCYAFNYGYHAAQYSIMQADLAAVHSPVWWLDVESVNSWTNSEVANREDIQGMIAALRQVVFLKPTIGIYTATNQWLALVGKWNIKYPLWLGTGSTSKLSASQDCSSQSITKGALLLTQYTKQSLDFDYSCYYYPPIKYF